MNIEELIKRQRDFSEVGYARDISYRIHQLQLLQRLLREQERRINEAIYSDFKKSPFETYLTELAMLHRELTHAIKYTARWSKIKKVKTDWLNMPGKSFLVPEPFGCALIIGAWNYPYQLTFAPLIAAMAAGNTAIIKPSELPLNTSKVIAELINQNFDPAYVHVLEGGAELTQELLKHRFDKIFFTGSTHVGKIVAKAAAEHLTPVTLELGGKSPCFVFADAPIDVTAKRIIWGKFLNAGQTCIAPDYVLVERTAYSQLLHALIEQIPKVLGDNPGESESYLRIINERHLARLTHLLDPKKIAFGGRSIVEKNYMEPTLLKEVDFTDPVMQEEIFGPILPIIPFDNLDAALAQVKTLPKPLSLYVFTKDKSVQQRIIREVSFGGGCINDVLMHITSSTLPFGGVGDSGMGSYHGEAGFKAFSHYKGILKRTTWFEPPLKYLPFSAWKLRLIKLLFG